MFEITSLTVAEIADRTVDAFTAMVSEVPDATSIEELADIFLGGDRKIFSGIMLAILAIVLIVFAG